MNYKIDPDNVTCFNLDKEGLELQILFWIFAAGKNGHTAARCLNNILSEHSKLTGLINSVCSFTAAIAKTTNKSD